MSIVLASFSAAPRRNTPSTSTSAVTLQVSSDSCQNPPPSSVDTPSDTGVIHPLNFLPDSPSPSSCYSPDDIHPLNLLLDSPFPTVVIPQVTSTPSTSSWIPPPPSAHMPQVTSTPSTSCNNQASLIFLAGFYLPSVISPDLLDATPSSSPSGLLCQSVINPLFRQFSVASYACP